MTFLFKGIHRMCPDVSSGCRYMSRTARARSHHEVLGVSPGSSAAEVKAAYFKLSKEYHPDLNRSADAPAKFREVSDAYETLRNGVPNDNPRQHRSASEKHAESPSRRYGFQWTEYTDFDDHRYGARYAEEESDGFRGRGRRRRRPPPSYAEEDVSHDFREFFRRFYRARYESSRGDKKWLEDILRKIRNENQKSADGNDPPRRRATKKAHVPKRPGAIPNGTIVENKKNYAFRVGDLIGKGRSADFYMAIEINPRPETDESRYIMKVETLDSVSHSPRFQGVATKKTITGFMKKRRSTSLGVLEHVTDGWTSLDGTKLRWLVMPRMERTVGRILRDSGGVFPREWVILLALQMLDILEFVHGKDCVHGDIKAENLMTESSKRRHGQVYLIGFGSSNIFVDANGEHVAYKESDSQGPHGSLEFMSIDSHNGADTSRRGDLQSLGYNLVHWLTGSLPWSKQTDPGAVFEQKMRYFRDPAKFFQKSFGSDKAPREIVEYFKKAMALGYKEKPSYARLRSVFQKAAVETDAMEGTLFDPVVKEGTFD